MLVFDENFNIFLGERAVGKTTLIWEISKLVKSLGYKICFIGGTKEFGDDDRFLSHFDFTRILSHTNSINAIKDIDLVVEIVNRDKYDFVFIDDIDFIDDILLSKIKTIVAKKITTCYNIPNISEYTLYNITSSDHDMNSTYIEYNNNNNKLDIRNFITMMERDFKIKNILNDKG